jgi:hypothetical protein
MARACHSTNDRKRRRADQGESIDDIPSLNPADEKTAKNCVVATLDELAAGKPVTILATRDYVASITRQAERLQKFERVKAFGWASAAFRQTAAVPVNTSR